MHRPSWIAAAAAFAVAVQLVTASGASAGIAYDSVTTFRPGTDASTLEPGSFAADFARASQPVAQAHHGGMFGKLTASIDAARGAMEMFHNGTAERRYIGSTRERVDNVAMQSATITDCRTRTITSLDLAKKTYSVVSMDRPVAPEPHQRPTGPSGRPGPMPTDDGTRFAMVLTTKALGPRAIDGTPTQGYHLDMKMTATKPTGESQTSDMAMTQYLSAYPEVGFACSSPMMPHPMMAGPGGAGMANYAEVMSALGGTNKRFKVRSSGPPMPHGKLSLFDVFSPSMLAQSGRSSGGGGFTIVVERGNVRTIGDDDPVFSVPPDFTKVAAP